MAGKGKSGKTGSVIIRKEEVIEGGHHGGAWKVAYADFVTAMMAFFLLLWLLNATTEEQRKGIADYFAPSSQIAAASSGSGMPFGGKTPFDTGKLVSDKGAIQVMQGKKTPQLDVDDDESDVPAHETLHRADKEAEPGDEAPGGPAAEGEGMSGPQHQGTLREVRAQQAAAEARRRERSETAQLEDAAEQLRQAVQADPALASIARQLAIDVTPEGLKVQILDEEKRPMFATGSAVPNEAARLLLQKVAPVLQKLPEAVSIAGHTDAAPFRTGERSNWELSAERADATRRLLVEAGLSDSRIRSVTGNADRDPLLPSTPLAAANRRVSIVVLRTTPVPLLPPPAPASPGALLGAPATAPAPAPMTRTP